MEFRIRDASVRVNCPSRDGILKQVEERLQSRQGFALATFNLDHLVKLSDNDCFRRAYAAQDMIVADGNPVVWLSRLARHPVELVTGADMVVPLVRIAALNGISVALVGSTQTALAQASKQLCAMVPDLVVALCLSPSFGFDPESAVADAVIDQIAASGAGLCLLALGAPKQEILAARARHCLSGVGFASIGAGLDFIAGQQTRAPLWMRRWALEWLWRLLLDPGRLCPRYARCAMVLPAQVIAALRLRWQAPTTDWQCPPQR